MGATVSALLWQPSMAKEKTPAKSRMAEFKIASKYQDIYVTAYHVGSGIEIVGENLIKDRLPLGIKTVANVKAEIARLYRVPINKIKTIDQ
jgi:hypothetical protein